MNDPRQWSFIGDMNNSGITTFNDVWYWIKWLFYYPGDGLLYLMIHKIPQIADYFEITLNNYGGTFSTVTSLIFWISLGYALMAAKD